MKVKQQNTMDMQQKKEEVMNILACLYFNIDTIPWRMVYQLAIFLEKNAHLGPAGTEKIASYLKQMDRFILEHLSDLNTPSFKAYMLQFSSSLVSLSTLNGFYKKLHSLEFPILVSQMQNTLSKNKNMKYIYEYVFDSSDEVLNQAKSVIEEGQVCEFPVRLVCDDDDEIFYTEYYKEFLQNSYNEESLYECYEKLADYREKMVLEKLGKMNEAEYDGKVVSLYYLTKDLNYKLHINQKRITNQNYKELTIKRVNRLRIALEKRILKTENHDKRQVLESYLWMINSMNASHDFLQINSTIDEMKNDLLRRVKNKEL